MTNEDKPPSPELLWYILSLFFPMLGIILAIMYMQKSGAAVKTFGRNCLIIAFLGLATSAVGCIIIAGAIALLS